MELASQQIRFDKDALIEELEKAGAKFKGSSIFCPFHDDKNPSGGIYKSKSDNVWRYKCQSTSCGFLGDIFDVRSKISGEDIGKVLPKFQLPQKPRAFPSLEQIESQLSCEIENRFIYTNPATGNHDLIVLRYNTDGRKAFKQIHQTHDGFIIGAPPKPWPLYNRTRLVKSDYVVVVEGEKCVHALYNFGITATTSPAGAGKAEYADWSILAGKKVYLWPDNDTSGISHMEDVAGRLSLLNPAPDIYKVNIEALNLPEKGDAADYINNSEIEDNGQLKQRLWDILKHAESASISGQVKQLIEDTISGKRQAISWPWKVISKLTKALLPGTITLICGDPGATKSFFLLEAAAYWNDNKIKVAVYELEEDRRYHLYRSLSQRAKQSNLFDDQWIKDNPEYARQLYFENQEFLNDFGKCIYEAPNNQATQEQLIEWVQQRADAGCRIIAIDPVTAAQAEDKPWIADVSFLIKLKRIVGKYKASLILVTHPKKGRKNAIGFDELAGGAAYARFVETILWIKKHKEAESVTIESPCGRFQSQINRTVYLCKTRNGIGQGLNIGFSFHGGTLKFDELGVIIPDD